MLEAVAFIREAVTDAAPLSGHANELVAALMALEDAVSAVEGYVSMPPLGFVDEAYLSRFGLLQALQLGFLTQRGTPITWKGYDGHVYQLPDGTQVGIWGSSSSGTPTIDIRNPNGSINKIHIAP